MYKKQFNRLTEFWPVNASAEQAAAMIARAYGYEKYDPESNSFEGHMAGYQQIKDPDVILDLDNHHQMMEFVRMTLNLDLPGPKDVRGGHDARLIIATMWGFSNFDALIEYVKSDPVDPNSTDVAMLEKFKSRFGYPAPIQTILGRNYAAHTLILHNDSSVTTRFIDQELSLNPLDDTRVAIVRTVKDGDAWLNNHVNNMKVYRGELSESHSSALMAGAGKGHRLFMSILPPKIYGLASLVAAHIDLLQPFSPSGRTLIIDGPDIKLDPGDFDVAFKMAANEGIHLVIVRPTPESELWNRVESRMVFGLPIGLVQSDLQMDAVLVASAPYVGLKNGKMQHVFHSEASGVRYAAMEFIPDTHPAPNVLSAIFSTQRG
ncbi:hypothetical protein QAO71_17530 (plasmid) [Halopseudomonas sp. SMJS2]|uniref:hypothetical protein n=1 Tax=Halopseudomonas sp. SMJS2 TaxID=3041098 RepID=UPI002452CF5A|nr:hypothetical protein [Halopseudomonas sp. SMJS2]WGK63343.1 hypothetical protein QAO71_17530 [Halopseudomonas sp. SMJS2]